MKWNLWDLLFRRGEITKELEEKEKKLKKLEEELQKKESKLKKLFKELKKKEEDLKKKEKDLEEREEDLEEAKKKLDEEKQNIAKEREQIFQTLQVVQKQLEQIQRQREEIQKQRDEWEKEKKEFKKKLKKKFSEKWKKLKGKLEKQIRKQKEKWQKRIKDLQAKIEKLQKKIIELEAQKEPVFIPTPKVPVKIVINSQNLAKVQIEFYVHSDYVGLIRNEIQQDLWGTEYMPTSDGFVWKFRVRTDAIKKKKKVEGEEGEEVDMSEVKALLQTEPDYKWFHVIRWLEDYRVEMTEEQYSVVSTVSGVAGWRLSKLFGQKYEIRHICPDGRLSGFAEVSIYVGNEAIEESENEEKEGEGE